MGGGEIHDTCEFNNSTNCTAGVQFGRVPPWEGSSADLFDSCSTLSGCTVPTNSFGFQIPHTGHGYVGQVFLDTYDSNTREYIEVMLDSFMISQHHYCCSFYVSASNLYSLGSNNVAMYISSTHTPMPSSGRLTYTPQILHNSIVSDTVGWTLISGEYVASGGEKYIVIGNFNTNAATDTLAGSSTYGLAYYYIDDVSVIDCTTVGITKLNPTPEITLYPNLCGKELGIKSTKNQVLSIKIYNLLGAMVNDKWLMVNG